ncbi:MAG: hypothetical protein J7498_15580 [Sphingobium sp.]|nr:hypothetical protein [Sphingobium sp.]
MSAAILATLAAGATPDCRPINGAQALIEDKAIHWIVVGELHGTVESPKAFADLVCLAGRSNRRVVVALERLTSEQSDIDAYLKSDGSPTARVALTSGMNWHLETQDGRSSQAYADMLEQLRLMFRARMFESIVTIMPAGPFDSAAYEKEMARVVQSAASTPDTLVLVLVGNTHARIKEVTFGGTTYMPMAGLLPHPGTRTLFVAANGRGTAWNCTMPKGAEKTICGVNLAMSGSKESSYGIGPATNPFNAYDADFYLGVPYTASPPAVGSSAP